jgi:hypothetical protein
MPEVVPIVFHMAWKPAIQPSEKTADRGRNIARLDTGDEPRDIAFQCKLPMRITIPYSWSQNRWINPLCSRIDALEHPKSGLVNRRLVLYQLGGDLDQEFALGVRKFRPELCNRASCDAGVPIGDGSWGGGLKDLSMRSKGGLDSGRIDADGGASRFASAGSKTCGFTGESLGLAVPLRPSKAVS